MQTMYTSIPKLDRSQGKLVDLEQYRRSRENREEPVWDGLVWARAGEEKRIDVLSAGVCATRERWAWALDVGASLSVAAVAAAFLLRAITF